MPSFYNLSSRCYTCAFYRAAGFQRKQHQQPLENKLQQQLEREDVYVKKLTETILYQFLPAALNQMLPQCVDPCNQRWSSEMELCSEKCRVGASKP